MIRDDEPRFAVDANGVIEDREPLADWIESLED